MKPFDKPIQASSPYLPPFADVEAGLREIYANRWLTNNGPLLQRFEGEMKGFLGAEHVSLLANATLALEAALSILEISGEVITTPFTFAATTHAIARTGAKPVFADIDPVTYNISPEAVASCVTPESQAILATHCFGIPCDHAGLEAVAKEHGLVVIYDAAHAMGVRVDGVSIANLGTASVFSLHATKLIHSCEGGVLVMQDEEQLTRANQFRNFGFLDGARDALLQGTNAKMSEMHALMGSLTLRDISGIIEGRRRVDQAYRSALADVPGVQPYSLPGANVEHNFSYMAVEVDEALYGLTRDDLKKKLRDYNVISRPYFSPLTSQFKCYGDHAAGNSLPVAEEVAHKVLCLPLSHDMTEEQVVAIVQIMRFIRP